MAEVFSTVGGRWAPALFTLLAMSWHPAALPGAGWLVIAGIVVVAVIGEGITPAGGAAAADEEAPAPSLTWAPTARGDAV